MPDPDSAEAALARLNEACPCKGAQPYFCSNRPCPCAEPFMASRTPGALCLYPGHAAARQLALMVFEDVRDTLAAAFDERSPTLADSIRKMPKPPYLQEPDDADR